MIQLNLLPDVKREFLRTQRVRVKVITAAFFLSVAAVAAVVVVALWVYGGQELQKKLLTDDIARTYKELRAVKDIDKYVTIQNQLKSITALHDDKNHFSRLLDYLPAINSGVKLSNIAVDTDATSIVMDGQTKDYTTLIIFRDTLKGATLSDSDKDCGVIRTSSTIDKTALFSTVDVTSSGIGTTNNAEPVVSFKITTTYRADACKSSIKKPKVCVPNKETTPSTVGTPGVFEEVKETE